MGALTSLSKNSGLTIPCKASAAAHDRKGRPDEMPLSKIHPDPNNSRRAEDENTPEGIEAQEELTEDIRRRGVRSPISLRPHPHIEDEFVINFGHRRFKGALDAGLATIPYFVDISFDSYDQVKENLLHRKPSIWALAEFVQRKLEVEQQSKGQIAEGLGKSQTVVTELLNLVNAPSCLHQSYEHGVRSPRTLYDLRRAYEEYPSQVDAWCDSGAKITRETIHGLLRDLRRAVPAGSEIADVANASAVKNSHVLRHDVKTGDDAAPTEQRTERDERRSGVMKTLVSGEQSPVLGGEAARLRHDEKKVLESDAPKAPLVSATTSVPFAQIIVEYQGKAARIASDATVRIFLQGEERSLEVPLSDLMFKRTK
jgi:ParB family transcriptional regulator, chromosome partitioning protein